MHCRQAAAKPLCRALLLVALMLACLARATALETDGARRPRRILLSAAQHDSSSTSVRSTFQLSVAADARVRGERVRHQVIPGIRRMLDDAPISDDFSSSNPSPNTPPATTTTGTTPPSTVPASSVPHLHTFPYESCAASPSAAKCDDMPFELLVSALTEGTASSRTLRIYPGITFKLQIKPYDYRTTEGGDLGGADDEGTPAQETVGCETMLKGLRELRIKLRSTAVNGAFVNYPTQPDDPDYNSEPFTFNATVNGIPVQTSIHKQPRPPGSVSATTADSSAETYLRIPLTILSRQQIASGNTSISLLINSKDDGDILSIPDYIVDTTQYVMTYPPIGTENVDPADRRTIYSAKIRYSLIPSESDTSCCPACFSSFMQTKLNDCPFCGGGDYYSTCVYNRVESDCGRAYLMCGFSYTYSFMSSFGMKNYPFGCVPCTTNPLGWCGPTNRAYAYCCAV
ncbi:hypothetical protein Agub_g15757 [Astrephomene gubernaculifera]|uniref:Uncharacterized protein n=1 Tax=Astrephomene gubernaculifera TaxID=47775 RepID=A0AAD3HU63_9CHLO|nr:hypothetical protein Agub_g15757 [Astrephomene gubernaculifera]